MGENKIKSEHGGLRAGSGRGKSGWYKGYWCDSSWELAWVIYNLEHEIKFERNRIGFSYIFEHKVHKYYPDFIIDNTFYEIKGYISKQVEEKIRQFTGVLIVLDGAKIERELNYVKNKYGNNFLHLYENSPYTKTCKSCKNILYKKNKTGLCKNCFKPEYRTRLRIKKIHKCSVCEGEIERARKTGLCTKCYSQTVETKRKVCRPEYETLINEVNNLGYSKVGKKYGVSDNAIRKWIKFYQKKMESKLDRVLAPPAKRVAR